MRRLHPALYACAAALGGCGGGDDPPARTVTVAAGEQLRVTARDYSFDPNRVVVQAGGRLKITLDNRGSLAHNIKVFDRSREIGGTDSLAGGERRSATVRVRAGGYRLVCTVGDHEEQGMVGTLEVR
jgi:plastocyanin